MPRTPVRRSDTHPGASRSDTQPGARRSAAAYGDPAQQFGYPDAQRATSAPNGYPVQPPAPAGNPYGSFVSQPAASYQPAPIHEDSGYTGGAYTSQQIPGGEGWYPAPLNGNGHNGHAANGHGLPPADGHLPASPNGYDQSGYRPVPPEATGYPQPVYPGAPYEQGGYAGQDARYGRDAYQGYPGQGASGY